MARATLLASALAALLAGCAAAAPENRSDNSAAPTNLSTAPPGNVAAAQDRPAMLAQCNREAAQGAPPGVDIGALCECAVDRVIAGARRLDAARQCASELGLPPPPAANRSGETG